MYCFEHLHPKLHEVPFIPSYLYPLHISHDLTSTFRDFYMVGVCTWSNPVNVSSRLDIQSQSILSHLFTSKLPQDDNRPVFWSTTPSLAHLTTSTAQLECFHLIL